jgi:TolB-like protein
MLSLLALRAIQILGYDHQCQHKKRILCASSVIRIALLPFENLSANQKNASFADVYVAG